MKKIKQLSALTINLPDVTTENLCLCDLDSNQFAVHWNHVCLDDKVHEFHGVIGQDKELIHTGDL